MPQSQPSAERAQQGKRMHHSLFEIYVPALATLLLLAIVAGLAKARNAALGGVILYMVVGLAIAGVQTGNGGECLDPSTMSFWQNLIDWPGDLYTKVWNGEMSLKDYLTSPSCGADGGTLDTPETPAKTN